MILSDVGAGLSILAVAILFYTNSIEIWHLYLAVAFNSTFSTFGWLAFTASTVLLVEREQLGRANGMVQSAFAASQVLSPVLAGVLITTIQLQGLLLIDFATFLISAASVIAVKIPRPAPFERKVEEGSLLRRSMYGFTYIKAKHGLLALLIYSVVVNFTFGIVEILFTPLVLSFGSAKMLGLVLSVGSSGMLIGSIFMSVWGGPKYRINGIFIFAALQGLVMFAGGFQPNILLITIAAFIYLFSFPIVAGCSQAIWQTKVAPEVQGRVFAMRLMISLSATPLGIVIAGPLAEKVFEPLLAPEGLLAGNVGRIIGVGQGRGVGLLFIMMGIILLMTTLIAYLYPPLRSLEEELPDAVITTIEELQSTK
jgi:MFS transporter, DHA3 family, macrolide efflux protein